MFFSDSSVKFKIRYYWVQFACSECAFSFRIRFRCNVCVNLNNNRLWCWEVERGEWQEIIYCYSQCIGWRESVFKMAACSRPTTTDWHLVAMTLSGWETPSCVWLSRTYTRIHFASETYGRGLLSVPPLAEREDTENRSWENDDRPMKWRESRHRKRRGSWSTWKEKSPVCYLN